MSATVFSGTGNLAAELPGAYPEHAWRTLLAFATENAIIELVVESKIRALCRNL